MEQLNKTPTTGKFGEIAKVLDTNFGLIVTKMTEYEQKSKTTNIGFYSTETELKTAYPNPEKGMMGYVGSGTEYVVYRCKTDGTWTKTDETFTINISVDLSTYATKEALLTVSNEVDGLMLGAVYRGMATTITNPGTPQTKVFYLPTEVGTYTNFGSLSVGENEVSFLYYDGSTWAKHTLDMSNNIATIKSTADTAVINAKNALDRANSAYDRAEYALTTGDDAQNAADNAQDTADTALREVRALEIPNIVYLTESEYESLEIKETGTIYMLYEEE